MHFPAFPPLDHDAALKIERKMSHLNNALDRYASIGTVMHYILVISAPVYIRLFTSVNGYSKLLYVKLHQLFSRPHWIRLFTTTSLTLQEDVQSFVGISEVSKSLITWMFFTGKLTSWKYQSPGKLVVLR